MQTCTFFGHRECYGLEEGVLCSAIVDLIAQGVTDFLVGEQGMFDRMVYGCLKRLRRVYPRIQVSVVLANLPTQKREEENMQDKIYPEIEGHPRFTIDRRNRWMVENADCCLCYITHTWGGAYKYACIAKRSGLKVINLGSAALGGEA